MFRRRVVPQVVALLIAVLAPAAEAQYPRAEPGRFEVRGLDFRRSGAWRRRADPVRAERRALLRTGALSRLNAAPGFTAAASRVEGTFSIPVILVRPSNVPEPFPASRYRSLLFDDRRPTARTACAASTRRCRTGASASRARGRLVAGATAEHVLRGRVQRRRRSRGPVPTSGGWGSCWSARSSRWTTAHSTGGGSTMTGRTAYPTRATTTATWTS